MFGADVVHLDLNAAFGACSEGRDESGRVLNSFLRPRKFGDPDDSPTFAGEMLCAVVRPKMPERMPEKTPEKTPEKIP